MKEAKYKVGMKTLSELIKEKKFDWTNSDINDTNFPVPSRLPSKETEYKLFHFDKYISSEDAIKEIEKEGYSPANLYELLAYDWDNKNTVVALGSVAAVGGGRDVPVLDRGGSRRYLSLRWFGSGWRPYCRFLAVRNSQTLEPSDTLTLGNLDARIKKLEEVIKSHNL